MKAVKKDVFDINKVTVVGSPTITSDGIASGFSESNYLRGATGITLGDNFKIQAKFTTGDDVTSYQGILRMQSTTGFLCSISNRTSSSRLVFGIKSDISVIPVMKANTGYEILLECQNGLLTTYYSENNSNLTKVSEVENVNITLTNTFLALGNNSNLYFWQGLIDLTAFKIYVDNQLVYSPTKSIYCLERRKEGFDLSKFTVVGSPTITEDGVASGFAVGSYVNVPILDLSSGDFEVDVTFNFIPMNRNQIIYRCATNNYTGAFGFLIATTTAGKFYLSGSDKDIVTNITLTQATYKAKLKVKNQIAYVYLNDDLVIETPFTKSITNGYLSFGYSTDASLFAGSINLPSISITVDGEEVFTGAKEKFYAIGDF